MEPGCCTGTATRRRSSPTTRSPRRSSNSSRRQTGASWPSTPPTTGETSARWCRSWLDASRDCGPRCRRRRRLTAAASRWRSSGSWRPARGIGRSSSCWTTCTGPIREPWVFFASSCIEHRACRCSWWRRIAARTWSESSRPPGCSPTCDARRASLALRLSACPRTKCPGSFAVWLAGRSMTRLRRSPTSLRRDTNGNPFFIIEVLHHLVETGALELGDGHWSLDAATVQIPEGIREVVGSRLDRLGTERSEMLRTAAVIGPRFDLQVVAEVLAVSHDAVLATLEAASTADLVAEATGSRRLLAVHARARATHVGRSTEPESKGSHTSRCRRGDRARATA